MSIGTDTGFFVELLRGNTTAVEVWRTLIESEEQAVCSALTFDEIERLGLRGVLHPDGAASVLEAIPAICQVVWLDNKEVLLRAARVGHGLGIPAVDAVILASFLQAGVKTIYTTDAYLASYVAKDMSVVNLRDNAP